MQLTEDTPSVTASTSEYFLTPKRRKVFHSDNEEGNPQIFVSPGTSSSYHVLQNAEKPTTPGSKLDVNNISSTVSRCSSLSDLSCTQYLTCPLSAEQLTEILSTTTNDSVAFESTCNESTSDAKTDNIPDNLQHSNVPENTCDEPRDAKTDDIINNVQQGTESLEEVLHNSPKYDSSNDEDEDFVPDSVDSDSSVSECSETSDDSPVENEDVEDDATDNGTENATEISDSDE